MLRKTQGDKPPCALLDVLFKRKIFEKDFINTFWH
jgi:hypothetical protein